MKKFAMAAVIFMCLMGCNKEITPVPSKPITPHGNQWSDAVTIDIKYINYIKTFHMQMTPTVSLQVDAKYRPWLETDCSQWCVFSFTMQQGDDPKKWVDFNCDAVAEKIINAELVPLAEQDCKLLRDEGIKYWKDHSDPDEFTDSGGRVWRRQ